MKYNDYLQRCEDFRHKLSLTINNTYIKNNIYNVELGFKALRLKTHKLNIILQYTSF